MVEENGELGWRFEPDGGYWTFRFPNGPIYAMVEPVKSRWRVGVYLEEGDGQLLPPRAKVYGDLATAKAAALTMLHSVISAWLDSLTKEVIGACSQ